VYSPCGGVADGYLGVDSDRTHAVRFSRACVTLNDLTPVLKSRSRSALVQAGFPSQDPELCSLPGVMMRATGPTASAAQHGPTAPRRRASLAQQPSARPLTWSSHAVSAWRSERSAGRGVCTAYWARRPISRGTPVAAEDSRAMMTLINLPLMPRIKVVHPHPGIIGRSHDEPIPQERMQ
jgi:hypothetical protein